MEYVWREGYWVSMKYVWRNEGGILALYGVCLEEGGRDIDSVRSMFGGRWEEY